MIRNLQHQSEAGFIIPRIRVFLSVDLIGSTEFKIRHTSTSGHPDQGWPAALMKFYTEFQEKLFENWQQWKERYQSTNSPQQLAPDPRLWKALGDELIFWKQCVTLDEICAIVQVWRKTIRDFKKQWTVNDLKFKSGAWLVGSPSRNWEVAFLRGPIEDDDRPYLGDSVVYTFYLLKQYYDVNCYRKIDIDFIGSSMDCGFRLLSLASEEKMILSADLAYLLLEHKAVWDRHFGHMDYCALDVFLDRPTQLRGVTAIDKPYPIAWLSAYGNAEDNRTPKYVSMINSIRGEENKKGSSDETKILLKSYLDDVDGFPDLPYICAPDEEGIVEVFGSIPSEHIDRINKFREQFVMSTKQEDNMVRALEVDEGGTKKTEEELEAIADEVLIRPEELR